MSGRVAERAQEQLPLARRVTQETPRPGRLTFSDYKTVADVYNAAAASGRRDPANAVAERYGIKPGTARKRVKRARDLALLPPTTERRARASDSQEPGAP